MAKQSEKADIAAPVTKQFFFPPQDGRDAFVCEATSQAEADAQYSAAVLTQ